MRTRRSPLVALIAVSLSGCLGCQMSSQSPSGSGASQGAPPSRGATGHQNGKGDRRGGTGPTAKDATAEDSDPSPIGTAGTRTGAPTEGQALSDEFIARILAPWNGDLPGIKERRYLRMLVTFNRTHYFADRLQQHGLTYDAGLLFEKFLGTSNGLGTRATRTRRIMLETQLIRRNSCGCSPHPA